MLFGKKGKPAWATLLLFLMVLFISASVYVDPVESIARQGNAAWGNLLTLYYQQRLLTDTASAQTIAENFSRYNGKIMQFSIDFENTVSDGENTYFSYRENGSSDIFLIPYHEGIREQLDLLSTGLKDQRNDYEVLAKVTGVQSKLGRWNNAVMLEVCALYIKDRGCFVVENEDIALVGREFLPLLFGEPAAESALASSSDALDADAAASDAALADGTPDGDALNGGAMNGGAIYGDGETGASSLASETTEGSDAELAEGAEAEEAEEEAPIRFAPDIRTRLGMAYLHLGKNPNLNPIIQLGEKFDIIGSIALSQDLSKNLALALSFERDPLLMNRLFADLAFPIGFADLETGAFFTLAPSEKVVISPGLSLRIKMPLFHEMFHGAFRIDLPLGAALNIPSTQTHIEVELGVTFPWASFNFALIDRILKDKLDVIGDMQNEWIRFKLSAEKTFGKVTIGLDAGYQEVKWVFSEDQPLDYHYDDVYLGLNAALAISSTMKLSLGLEAPVFPWVYSEIQSIVTPQTPVLFGLSLGFDWTPSAKR
jgi:hypothetical protein